MPIEALQQRAAVSAATTSPHPTTSPRPAITEVDRDIHPRDDLPELFDMCGEWAGGRHPGGTHKARLESEFQAAVADNTLDKFERKWRQWRAQGDALLEALRGGPGGSDALPDKIWRARWQEGMTWVQHICEAQGEVEIKLACIDSLNNTQAPM